MKNPWQTHGSKVVFKNPYWEVRQDDITTPDGKPGTYNVVVTPGSVYAVAVTNKKEFVLVKQFRYITARNSLEVAGGGISNEDPLECAKRELREESGIMANEWQKLGILSPINGIAEEDMNVYLATDLDLTDVAPEHAEGINEVCYVPFDDVLELIKSNEIDDGQTVAAIFMAALHLGLLAHV